MARAKEEQRQQASGAILYVAAGFAILFLLCMALLNRIWAGVFLSEAGLVVATLILYGAAGALYMAYGATGAQSCVKFASIATWLGLAANTAAIALRWHNAGHAPFSNVYEMLLNFVWALAALTLLAEKRFGIRLIGALTMPVAIVGVILTQSLRKEAHPLVPLLQSNWLSVHVTLAILAYAMCALSFAFAIMFLIKDRVATASFLALTGAATLAIYTGVVLAVSERWGGMWLLGANPRAGADASLFPGIHFSLPLCALGWLMVLGVVVSALPLCCYFLAQWTRHGSFLTAGNRSVFACILVDLTTIAILALQVPRDGFSLSNPRGIFREPFASSPFLTAGLAGGIFVLLFFLLLVWRRADIERLLPTSEALDRITYRTICLAFPLLTLTIATGAYWANQAWGSYWSWDPKETWAAITWLVYALYLHMRITIGWRGRRAAYFAIAGFAVVVFTFFGVTYLLRGMHAFS
jgi:ABC-type transport system involved in cytochrome c biogenesis permease subunit